MLRGSVLGLRTTRSCMAAVQLLSPRRTRSFHSTSTHFLEPRGRNLSLQSFIDSDNRDKPEVNIVEVSPRDGLQNEKAIVPSASEKLEFIKLLHRAGCRHIEAGSFVSPKWVPSMADSGEVMRGLHEWRTTMHASPAEDPAKDDLVLSCLVPNLKGLEAAIRYHADEIAIFGSASEAFSQKNIACSIDESFERFREVVDAAKKEQKHGLKIRGYISCVIGCPYEGKVPPSQVAKVVERMAAFTNQISLGDTIGVGTPASTLAMLADAQKAVGDDNDRLAVHFHDTYGQALANILVSLERGISTVDSSVAGLGGCPYAGEGASGNVATEDVVYMLNGMGVQTGIDLLKLVDAGEFICRVLNRPSRSRAGSAIASTRKRHGEEP